MIPAIVFCFRGDGGEMTGAIVEGVLAERLGALSDAYPGPPGLVRELAQFLRTASDEEIVRINPLRLARELGWPADAAVALLLHARKAGLVTMSWHFVCRGCGQVVEDFRSLTEVGDHVFCRICLGDREADLSNWIEVAFTVSRAVRTSRFHDRDALSASDQELFDVSANALAGDGTPMRDFYRRARLFAAYIEPEETKRFELTLAPGRVYFSDGRSVRVVPGEGPATLALVHTDARDPGRELEASPGPVTCSITNATSMRYRASALGVGDSEAHLFDVRLTDFLSGSRLLATQAFRDLFPSETVMGGGRLAISQVALLFTDIKGSTALYDRVGDVRAFDLVRQHFGILRDVITANSGALVKTIGDAVMASFEDPLDAVRAARDMLVQIEKFNASAGEELIRLKIGAHAGRCLAVTLNERLDYFGQAVNKAARVQALADANQIYLTSELYGLPGAESVLEGLEHDETQARVKGIGGEMSVRRYAVGARRVVGGV
jgi:class 3 adenylate cyclase